MIITLLMALLPLGFSLSYEVSQTFSFDALELAISNHSEVLVFGSS